MIDHFRPMPIRVRLATDAWGAPGVLEVPKDQEKGNDRHRSKIIVVPFEARRSTGTWRSGKKPRTVDIVVDRSIAPESLP